MKMKFLALTLLAAFSSGCAGHQLRFDPWKGLPLESVQDLKQGIYSIPKEKLFDAAAATLDHEPYFHWTFSTFDRANGLIIGSAGLFREVQLRVMDQSSSASAGQDSVKSRLSVSVPRRALKTQAKIYVLKSDASKQTAYEPSEAELGKYDVVAADAEIDSDYFYSFTYRVLNDRTQVPFKLSAYQEGDSLGQPPAQASTPEALPTTNQPQPLVEKKAELLPEPSAKNELPPAHRE